MSIKLEANKGRDLYSEFNGRKYARIPIQTHFLEIGENLDSVLEKYVRPTLQKNDILCISCKIISFTKNLVVRKEDVKISWLAKLITKFVKKWPNDIGYSSPRKMQVAINRAGYPRMIVALIVGSFLKLFGLKGYFYRIAGNQINAIDGFTVGYTKNPVFENYAFLPPTPKEGRQICNEIESEFGSPVAIMDGNNIENNVMGMSDTLAKMFKEEDFKEIMKGNPQGQEDDGNNTPIIIVREVIS
jgi:F420-0:gamma-glutamyl ligase-like protein